MVLEDVLLTGFNLILQTAYKCAKLVRLYPMNVLLNAGYLIAQTWIHYLFIYGHINDLRSCSFGSTECMYVDDTNITTKGVLKLKYRVFKHRFRQRAPVVAS